MILLQPINNNCNGPQTNIPINHDFHDFVQTMIKLLGYPTFDVEVLAKFHRRHQERSRKWTCIRHDEVLIFFIERKVSRIGAKMPNTTIRRQSNTLTVGFEL